MKLRLFALLVLASCGRQPAPTGRPIVDSRGKTVLVPERVHRVVSLLPGLTEMVASAGGLERLVGVSDYCDTPSRVKSIAHVGGLELNVEKILSLKPDLVVSSGTMLKEQNNRLEELGLCVFSIDPDTLTGVIEAIATLEDIFQTHGESVRLRERLKAATERVFTRRPKVLFEFGTGPIWTAGVKTHVGQVIDLAGGDNICKDAWRTIEWEQVLTLKPDIVIASHGKISEIESRAGWSTLGAKLVRVDPDLWLRAGPRLIDALEGIVRELH